MTPRLRWEGGHAWGLRHAKRRNLLTLPWVQVALDTSYSPDAPPSLAPDVAYVTLRWAFSRLLWQRFRNKGAGVA